MLKDLIRKARAPDTNAQTRSAPTKCPRGEGAAKEPPLLDEITVSPTENLDVEVFPDVVSEDYEQKLIDYLLHESWNWKRVGLGGRRAAVFGGEVTSQGLRPAPLPAFLQSLCDRLSALLPNANHVLVNVYQPGEGILPHTDGPAYYPKVCVISLGSACVLNIADTRKLIPARSLLVFQGEAYRGMHSIAESTWDMLPEVEHMEEPATLGTATRSGNMLYRGLRISLTIRHVWPMEQPA
eukprot:GEMP01060130.1.p2 GENE.GEMP01060130.1~~GEMP01060130.1.p2  ORF type:complete len:239 (+),score=56.15 GEMP01060130.1:76-792(+)